MYVFQTEAKLMCMWQLNSYRRSFESGVAMINAKDHQSLPRHIKYMYRLDYLVLPV